MDLESRPISDPSVLPKACFVHILAHLISEEPLAGGKRPRNSQTVACTGYCALTACALVSKRWRAGLHCPEADATLWRKMRLEDCCIPRQFYAPRFLAAWRNCAARLLEMDVALSAQYPHQNSLQALASTLPDILRAARNLKSLRLAGPLPIGTMLSSIDFAGYPQLSFVTFAGGQDPTWGLCEAVRAIAKLPQLVKLQIHIPNDTEEVTPELSGALATLTTLRHLALRWPLRSALPPIGDLPSSFGDLTRLTTLQLRRLPLQCNSPDWLRNLRELSHLCWDPYLPVDQTGEVPAALSELVNLKTLYIEMKPPLALPSSLTALETLMLVGRGMPDNGAAQEFGWLNGMTRLKSLRLQGARLRSLPEPVRALTGLTRLGLMCNDLSDDGLPVGPWVSQLEYLHLGNNCIHGFPQALRSASQLRELHLANQRSGPGVTQVARNVSQRLVLTGGDVSALLGMPQLEVLVMSMGQAAVQLGGRLRDFQWLQRVLRQRKSAAGDAIRLTSNELAYCLDPFEVFLVKRMTPNEIKEA